jgi:rhamnulokinase
MQTDHTYLAIDLGAESGRAITGSFQGDKLSLKEVHRFSNDPVQLSDGYHWDVLRLWKEIQTGVAAAANSGSELSGIGLDTWGVDFGLLDRTGGLLGNPFHYRDARTDGMLAKAFERMPRSEIFEHTGIQFMQINTLYQLLAMVLQRSPQLEAARSLLTIPDLFNYWLSGEITNEFSIATTTQCYDPRTCDWAWPVLSALEIPHHLFRPVIQPGTIIGPLQKDVAERTGAGPAPVVAPACHDTGSAVVAVPAESEHFAWISSGTWSIIGAEAMQPVISPESLGFNFTNEGGVYGTWRLSKNVIGLWLVQECRRTWAAQGQSLSYDEITHMAAEAPPFLAVIDPDDGTFLHPGDMPERIRAFCLRTGQAVPQTHGEIIRVALESIALKYRWVIERLEMLVGMRLEPIHIIGGGTKNRLLNQFTADATGRTVITGPVEATASGNVLVQAIALGRLGSLADARHIVRQSFAPQTYQPGSGSAWEEAYARLVSLSGGN